MSAQWDEVVNLNGGLFLLRGNIQQFFLGTLSTRPYTVFSMQVSLQQAAQACYAGRLVSVVFSVLSIFAVFEFTYRMYNPKTALLATAMFAVMPGYVWLSRMAMIETTLIFFFTVATLSFFFWLKEHKNKFLTLSAVNVFFGCVN